MLQMWIELHDDWMCYRRPPRMPMTTNDMKAHLVGAGFKYVEDLIHLFQGGSHQHGASIPGKLSDIDIFGVYIEPPTEAVGVIGQDHFTAGTQDQYERNRPGDEDYKCYTLNRWAGLACKGNPTILGFLYTPLSVAGVWSLILENRHLLQASSHAKAFLGYAKGQVARLDGGKGRGKHGQRPELEQQFGYDTKAAMHLMRLMFEAEEYMLTGNITYPRPEKELLLSIRLGGWSWDRLFREYSDAEKRVEDAMKKSKLPEHVDRKIVSDLLARCYIVHWRNQGLLDSYTK